MQSEKSKVFDIHRKSDYVLEVLEKTPSWVIVWGNSFIFIFIFLLILLSAFISYPDKIVADAKITLDPPPLAIISQEQGEIQKIFKEDKSKVENGEVVLKMYSRANLAVIQNLKDNLKNLKKSDAENLMKYNISSFSNLGEITDPYSNLVKDIRDFHFFLDQDIVFIKVKSLYEEISRINDLNNSLKKQEDYFEKQYRIKEKSFRRFKSLHEKGVISDAEKERIEADYLIESRNFEKFKTEQINNRLEIERLKTRISDLLGSRENELSVWVNRIKEKIIIVLDEIEDWEDKHLIKAPASGILSIDKNYTDRYFINKDDILFNIIPFGKKRVIGFAEMPVNNSGGVEPGAEVQIRLDPYPYQEHGFIIGKIKDISLISKQTEGGYINLVEIELPFPLVTESNKEIPFSTSMTGTALIIKDKQSLLERTFDKVVSVFK